VAKYEASYVLAFYESRLQLCSYEQMVGCHGRGRIPLPLLGAAIALRLSMWFTEFKEYFQQAPRLNHRDNVKFISTQQDTQCRISL